MQFLDDVWKVISSNAEHAAAVYGLLALGTVVIPPLHARLSGALQPKNKS